MEVEIRLEDLVAGTDAAREALEKCDVMMGYDRDGSGSRQMFYGLQTVQECHGRDDRLRLVSLRVVRVPVRFAEGCDEDLQLVAACVAIKGSHCYMKGMAVARALIDAGLGGFTVRRGRYRYTVTASTEVVGEAELLISGASGAADLDFN